MLTPWKENSDKTRQCIQNQRSYFANKCPCNQSYGFSSSLVLMWKLNHKEGWVPKKWCFQIVVLEKTLENLLDCKEIKPVNPKGNQHWMFIGRTLLKLQYFAFPMQELTHWKTPWCWKRKKTKGDGSSRRWDD